MDIIPPVEYIESPTYMRSWWHMLDVAVKIINSLPDDQRKLDFLFKYDTVHLKTTSTSDGTLLKVEYANLKPGSSKSNFPEKQLSRGCLFWFEKEVGASRDKYVHFVENTLPHQLAGCPRLKDYLTTRMGHDQIPVESKTRHEKLLHYMKSHTFVAKIHMLLASRSDTIFDGIERDKEGSDGSNKAFFYQILLQKLYPLRYGKSKDLFLQARKDVASGVYPMAMHEHCTNGIAMLMCMADVLPKLNSEELKTFLSKTGTGISARASSKRQK